MANKEVAVKIYVVRLSGAERAQLLEAQPKAGASPSRHLRAARAAACPEFRSSPGDIIIDVRSTELGFLTHRQPICNAQ